MLKNKIMPKELSKEEIQKRVKTIEAVYQGYLEKLNELKRKQSEIIDRFIKELERGKIEELRKLLK